MNIAITNTGAGALTMAPCAPKNLVISGVDGHGSGDGRVDDANEAARVFIGAVRGHFALDRAFAASEGSFRMGARAMREAVVNRLNDLCAERIKAKRPRGNTDVIDAVATLVADIPLPNFPKRQNREPGGWGWWADRDGEWFSEGPFNSRDDAIAAGRAEFDGDAFHIIEAVPGSFRLDADELINRAYFDADDLFDYDRSEPGRIGGADVIQAADEELQFLLDAWLDRWRHTFIRPAIFANTRNAERIAASADADA